MSNGALDDRDRAIVNAFQGGFPVVRWPFGAAADTLRNRGVNVDADELLDRIARLLEDGVLDRFGPLVDVEKIGGYSTLAAVHAPESAFDEVVDAVTTHREVTCSYELAHPHLNVWFGVTVLDGDRAPEVLADIEEAIGRKPYDLPARRTFPSDATFLVDGPLADSDVDLSALGPNPNPSSRDSLTAAERELVRAVQDGLPTTLTPYEDVADALDVDVDWVLETLRRLVVEEKIRRIGVVPNHEAVGYTENALTVWNVPDDVATSVGPELADLDGVTLVAERPRHENWPYNVYAAVYAQTEAERVERVEAVRGVMTDHWTVHADDWESIASTRLLERTGVRLVERADANTTA